MQREREIDMTKLYKIFRKNPCNHLTSLYKHPYLFRYRMHRQEFPVFGKFFGFKNKRDAIDYLEELRENGEKNLQLWECQGELVDVMVSIVAASPTFYRGYWKGENCTFMLPAIGSRLYNWVKPEKRIL